MSTTPLPSWNPRTQTTPAARKAVPCGTEKNVRFGRDQSKFGWYRWVAGQCTGMFPNEKVTVLDVGTGLGGGLTTIFQNEPVFSRADGYENDPRFLEIDGDAGFHSDSIFVHESLSFFESGDYDVVSCVCTLEHVLDDKTFYDHLLRIAKRAVFIVVPNSKVLYCHRDFHFRDYSVATFANAFMPSEVWGGDVNASVVARLLEWDGPGVRTFDGQEFPLGRIPADYPFTHHEFEDTHEPPFFCAVILKD